MTSASLSSELDALLIVEESFHPFRDWAGDTIVDRLIFSFMSVTRKKYL
jgi:hypothetical protein